MGAGCWVFGLVVIYGAVEALLVGAAESLLAVEGVGQFIQLFEGRADGAKRRLRHRPIRPGSIRRSTRWGIPLLQIS